MEIVLILYCENQSFLNHRVVMSSIEISNVSKSYFLHLLSVALLNSGVIILSGFGTERSYRNDNVKISVAKYF